MKSIPSNMVMTCSIYETRFIGRQKCLKGTFDEIHMKPCLSNMVLIRVIINNGPIGQNQKCLKRAFGKSHMKPGPPDMTLVCQ